MSYRNDFYIKDNIIGYTGDLRNEPTVYFLEVHPHNPNLKSFGRITQFHEMPERVGREFVFQSKNYHYGNDLIFGEPKLVERICDHPIHMSRNKFISVDQEDQVTINILANAIEQFTTIKPLFKDHLKKDKTGPSKGELIQEDINLHDEKFDNATANFT